VQRGEHEATDYGDVEAARDGLSHPETEGKSKHGHVGADMLGFARFVCSAHAVVSMPGAFLMADCAIYSLSWMRIRL
jgi:hypothetical protein